MRRWKAAATCIASVAGLFAFFMAFGMITRPIALLVPSLYAFHAVLMALPASFALSFCLRKGVLPAACVAAVCLFAAVLASMSPVMGVAALAPLVLTAVVWSATGRMGRGARACASGFAYGAAYYPCTLVASTMFGAMVLGSQGQEAASVLISIGLGAAFAALGALLASKSHEMEGA